MVSTPWKIWVRQIGSSSQLLGKIKFMFQTTNQISPLVSSIKCGGPRGNQRNSKRRFLIAGKIIPGWGIFPQPQQATGRSTPKRAMGIWRSYDDKKWYNKTYIYIYFFFLGGGGILSDKHPNINKDNGLRYVGIWGWLRYNKWKYHCQ